MHAMKNKKLKSSKVGSKRKKAPSDVSPSTSLPPLLEGQLRCFLRVTVSRILWTIPKPPAAPRVRVRWWGESSDGTHFRPRDSSQIEQRSVKTTARFPIRCGPKQFTSYLTDMGTLVLEVLTKPDHLPLGRVQINGIARLSPSYAISGFFTVVSPTSEKLGELQVSLALEPLSETYDSSSSVPTTDVSIDTAMSALNSRSKSASHENLLVVPSLPRRLSVNSNSGRESIASSGANTPRGKDHLYFQEKSKTQKQTSISSTRPEDAQGNLRRSSHNYMEGQGPCTELQGQPASPRRSDAHGQASKDILSILLDRGSKLRNAMVVSALKSDLDSEPALKDIPHPVSKDNISTSVLMPPVHSSGKLLQNLLHPEPGLLPLQNNPLLPPDFPEQDSTADTENRAIELLLGSINGSPLQYWDGAGSSPESLSGASSFLGESELNDPHYDQSLLENLFYNKAPKSDVSLSDLASEEDDGLGGKRKRKTRGATGQDAEEPLTEPGRVALWRKGHMSERVGLEGKRDLEAEQPRSAMLSVDQVTVLGRVHLARVIIHSLSIPADTTPHKTPGKGKPPRPLTTRKCTYFVEYLFPVASSGGDPAQVSMATEVTRVASNKMTGGVVNFQQRFVFPVQFSGAMIERWWNMDLVFNIYARKISQKKPVPIGKANFPLRELLQSAQLTLSTELQVLDLEGERDRQDLGRLKVSFELAADNKDFSSANARSAGVSKASSYAVTSPGKKIISQHGNNAGRQQSSESTGNTSVHGRGNTEVERLRNSMEEVPGMKGVQQPSPSHAPPVCTLKAQGNAQLEEEDGILLHALLMVPDGKDFNPGPMQPCNLYLNCKLFGSDETTRSPVIWGQNMPTFNFTQVAPVTLTSRLLERMRNNMVVIEVWQKVTSPGQDHLLGLVKLPLHQFYMSFKDAKISQLLLQAQYPVVGVDSYMPVVDVFTGISRGSLRVLLAMGLAEQIVALQRLRDEELSSASDLQRPIHSLDHIPHSQSKVHGSPAHKDSITEHVFEITVERVQGLTPLQSTVWGEADCYIQYCFPTQATETTRALDSEAVESGVSLKPFRTATTLCVPDPVFSHSQSHSLLVHAGVPVQRLLLSACSRQGPAGIGGIQFEVWCRYYYPNVRDQVVAKGVLPLSKLCAMVTMQRQEQTGAQVFSLPLVPRTDGAPGHQPQPSGLLDVCIQYKHWPMRTDRVKGGAVASRVVSLAVRVHRAAGLQAAARAVAKTDGEFQYYADIGVNTYVTIQLSFFPERERKMTRVVARSFCPEFDHHTEFPCNLVIQRASGETCSVAELLESAEVTFTLCHRDSNKGRANRKSKDTVLGKVQVHLGELIHKRTGISGWFAVNLPRDRVASDGLQDTVGGLEVSVCFAHHSDRERVIRAARALGWDVEVDSEGDALDSELWLEREGPVTVTVSVPRVWLPLHCLLLAGKRELDRSTYCYFRYKLYDGKAFCSSLRHPSPEEEDEEEGVATVTFPGSRAVELRSSPPLHWYLREERLEVQVWVAFGKERRLRPHDSDRLVGSAYVDLSALARGTGHKLAISGVYPLFNRTAPDLSGAVLRLHVALTPYGSAAFLPHTPYGDGEAEDGGNGHYRSEDSLQEHPASPLESWCQKISSAPSDLPGLQVPDVDVADTFAVSITVERAMHLSLKGSPMVDPSAMDPSCCVSYATADLVNPVTTQVIQENNCPVWEHHQQTRLSKEILVDPQQTLVFKVWHKGDVERVIGFASVDLSPLLSGFQSVCGWYNITDFNGQCQGQLKVAISPLETVKQLGGQRLANIKGSTEASAVPPHTAPLSYRTTALYSAFPTHIARYPEQLINTSPDQADILSERSSACGRHEEHRDNVRRVHQSLQQGERLSWDTQASGSSLFTALRKNLSELDDIQRYFSQKLSTPTFPSLREHRSKSGLESAVGQEPQHHADCHSTDSSQLLEKSSKLVGEVNNLMNDLHGTTLHVSSEPPHFLPPSSCNAGATAQDSASSTAEFPEVQLLLHQEADNTNQDGGSLPASSAVPSTHQQVSVENTSEGNERLSDRDCDERDGFGSDSHSEGDYEETVVQQRPLNDVTALTDKTSPWSSLLSEPDMASVEELEEPAAQEHLNRQSDSSREENIMARGSPLPDILHDGHSSMPGSARTAESPRWGGRVWPTEWTESDENEEGAADRLAGQPEALSETEGEAQDQERRGGQASTAPLRLNFSLDAEDLDDTGKDIHSEPCHRNKDSDDEIQSLSNAAEHLQDRPDSGQSERGASPSKDDESPLTKLADSMVMPNFFLPTQHLEMSMRALRIAPVFSSASSHQTGTCVQQGIPFRRATRPKPTVPTSFAKTEETKRIAKIFAAQFTEKK
ncbi:C2 domain-containing protein 3 isoform X2 [Amia ocellicauda]|uniref:C2 domain-containing protein 3 isoform X2 n=1 Tax=Amia ocellicauda TaxID=2972642 RepID=UPI003463BE4E